MLSFRSLSVALAVPLLGLASPALAQDMDDHAATPEGPLTHKGTDLGIVSGAAFDPAHRT